MTHKRIIKLNNKDTYPEQNHKVMKNIKQIIEETGVTKNDLVKIVVEITDIKNREAI